MSYKFKVGDKGKTRGGTPYRVICTDAKNSSYPIIALVGEHTERAEYYTSGGSYVERLAHTTYDLLPPTVTKYLNVCLYTDGTCVSYLHLAEDIARAVASNRPFKYVLIAHPVEVQES